MRETFAAIDPAAYLAIVLLLASAAQVISWRAKVPSLLLLLVIGFGLGQLVRPDDVLGRDVLFAGVTLAVGIILFEGALNLSLREVRDLGGPVRRLCSLTVVIAWALITLAAWAVGFEPVLALLVGAILVVTGPTVIGPILRILRPTRRVASLLRWEGIVVDPIGAVLAVLVFQAVLAGRTEAMSAVFTTLAMTIAVAFGIALPVGILVEVLLRRHVVPEFLQGAVFLSVAVGALVGANSIQAESGLLAVTVLGVYLGNRKGLHLHHITEFKEHLQVLFVGTLFVLLAGRISPGDIVDIAPQAAVFIALLIFVVRPASVYLGLWGSGATGPEKTLLSFMAPRGIVAASVISIFALEFEHAAEAKSAEAEKVTGPAAQALTEQAENLFHLAEGAEQLVPLVFLVIVATVAVYGLGVGRLAQRLGLASASPQGVLFVGAQQWVIESASLLEEMGVPTLINHKDYRVLAPVRRRGLPNVQANILSDYAVQSIDLAGIASFVGATDSNDMNGTAAREFGRLLGAAHTYQVRRSDTALDPDQHHESQKVAGHLSARILFQPALSHPELEALVEAGYVVKKTRLTEEFDLAAFRERYGDDAVLMFLHNEGKLTVVAQDTKVPEKDVTVIALVDAARPARPEPAGPETDTSTPPEPVERA